ncbi:hypothetical protein HAP94_08330 [Acidithiobacillus ferrivorans]|nr:hypothetical protein [Acidithiobacillus ferrivorans]
MTETTTPEVNKTQQQQNQAQAAEPQKRKSRLESYSQAYALSETKVQKLLGHAKEQEDELKACNDPRAARKLTAEVMTTYTEVTKATKSAGRNLEAYLREEKSEERRTARTEALGKLVTAVKNAIHRGFEAIMPKIPQDLQQQSVDYVAAMENVVDGVGKEIKELTARVTDLEASTGKAKAVDAPLASAAPPVTPNGDPRVNKALDAVSAGKTEGMSMENLKAALKDQQSGASGQGIKQPYDKGIGDPPAAGGTKLGQAVKKKAEELGQSAKEHGIDIGDDGRKAQQAVMDSADRLDTSIDAVKSAPAAEVARAWTDLAKSANNMTTAIGGFGKHVMAKAAEKGDKVRNIIGEKVRDMFKANKQAVEQSIPVAEMEKLRLQSAEQAKQIADLQAQTMELLTQNRIQAAKLQPAGPEKAAMVQALLENGVSTNKLKDLATPAETLKQFTGRAQKVGNGVALVDEKGKLVLLDKVAAEKLEHIRNRDEISVSRKDPQSEFAFRNRTIEQTLGQGKEGKERE